MPEAIIQQSKASNLHKGITSYILLFYNNFHANLSEKRIGIDIA
jgi:hypothetical protein